MNAYFGPWNKDIMTEAAAQALDELLEQRRDQVLEVARRTSPNELLTAADVVRAYYSSQERRPSPVTARSSASRPSMLGLSLSVVTAAVVGLAAVLLNAWLTLSGENHAFPAVDPITIMSVSASLLGLVLATSVLGWSFLGPRKPARKAATRDVAVDGPDYVEIRDLNQVAVLKEWSKVEDRLRDLANSLDSAAARPPVGRQPIGVVIAHLLTKRVIDIGVSADLRRVVAVRNSVAHGEPVSGDRLEEAVSLLRSLDSRLEKLQHGTQAST